MDVIKINLQQAQNYMREAFALRNPNLNGLSSKDRMILDLLRTNISHEISNLNLDLNETSTEPFFHNNNRTWIETDLKPFGQIRVRLLPFANELENYSPFDFIHWLAHEIGHHLTLDPAEQEANDIALAIENFISLQSATPGLYHLSLGQYRTPRQGCRDHIEVEQIWPLEGKLRIKTRTSNCHCRILRRYMEAWLKPSWNWIFRRKTEVNEQTLHPFDTAVMNMDCQSNKSGTIVCRDSNPIHEFRICPRYASSERKQIQAEEGSTLEFKKGRGLSAQFKWCLYEDSRKASIAEIENIYSQFGQMEPLSEEEKLEQLNVEKNFGGGLSHIFY